MALSQISPPSTKNAKVGAMQTAASVFDILGSLGDISDKIKGWKAKPLKAPKKDVYEEPVDEFINDVSSTTDFYNRQSRAWADARLSAKTKGMQNPMYSAGNVGINRRPLG